MQAGSVRKSGSALLAGTAFVLVASAMPAAAQTADAAPAAVSLADEIVVTARKREEGLLDTPLTVAVIGDRFIDDANIRSATDLAALTPGFTFETIGSRASAKPVIRGVTTNSTSPSQQKNSSFIDGIYLGGSPIPPPFIEIERVEVLKGPQSATFGRATFSGALNYVMKEPGESLSGEVTALAATDQEFEAGGLIGGPLSANGALRGQVAAYYRTFDGNDEWVNSDGLKLGTEKSKYAAATLLFDPGSGFRAKFRYQYNRFEDGPSPTQFVTDAQRNGVFNVRLLTARGLAPVGTTFVQRFPTGVVNASLRPFNQDFSVISDPGTDIEKHRLTGQIEAEIFGGHEFSVLAGYNTDDTTVWDGDSLNRRCSRLGQPATGNTCARGQQEYQDFDIEARITSPGGGALQYLAGVFYINSEDKSFFAQPNTGAIFFAAQDQEVKSISPFASASYDFGGFKLGVEGRYNTDDITNVGYRSCTLPATSAVVGADCLFTGGIVIGNPFTGVPGVPLETRSAKFKTFVYRATADVNVTDDILLYGVVSRGNQPGLFNLGAGIPDRLKVVEEEFLQNYELGLKGSFLGGRGYFTLAGFRMDWDNQQFRRTLNFVTPPGGVLQEVDPAIAYPVGSLFSTGTAVVNQGSSKISGIEAEVALRPDDRWDLRGTVAYTRARYKSFCSDFLFQLTQINSPPNAVCRNVDGNRVEAQPDLTYSFSAGYTQPVGGDWSMFARGDYSYTGSKFDSEMNLAETGSAKLLGAQLGLRNERVRFELFGNNLLDEESPVRIGRLTDGTLPTTAVGTTPAGATVTVTGASQQSVAVVPRRNRQFGVRMLYKF